MVDKTALNMKTNFLLHFRPRKIPAGALRYTLTWGLGGAAALMLFVQLLTGLLLNLTYKPVPVQAWTSVQSIQTDLFLGRLIRNMHHWTGHFLVLVVCLHLLRVFFNGAYFTPRRNSWYIGLALLFLVLAANFTGYLLPWDQLAFWAVTIAGSMVTYMPPAGEWLQQLILGGNVVSGATLQMFHSLHTTLLPAVFLFTLFSHFWCIRKAGGVKVDPAESRKMLPAVPELLVRELAFAAVIFSFLLLFAMGVDAPLSGMANPAVTPETVKAPWYFLWFQELLLHLPPVLALCILPLAFTAFLLLLPFLGQAQEKPTRPVRLVFSGFFLVITALTVTGLWFWGPGMKLILPW
jgi:quinol-cytochrome oxidoreductase complex cytochrome b subunit